MLCSSFLALLSWILRYAQRPMSSIASTPTTQKTTMTPGWREAKFERRTSDEYSVGMAAIVKEDEEEEEEGVKMRWRLVGFWR